MGLIQSSPERSGLARVSMARVYRRTSEACPLMLLLAGFENGRCGFAAYRSDENAKAMAAGRTLVHGVWLLWLRVSTETKYRGSRICIRHPANLASRILSQGTSFGNVMLPDRTNSDIMDAHKSPGLTLWPWQDQQGKALLGLGVLAPK